VANIVLFCRKEPPPSIGERNQQRTRRNTKMQLPLKLQLLGEPLCPLWLSPVCLRRFAVGALGSFAQRHKTRRVIRCDISQDFAVQLNAGLLQAADELVVADALGARRRADADDPDRPVLALLLLTSGVGKFEAALHRFFGGAKEF